MGFKAAETYPEASGSKGYRSENVKGIQLLEQP